MVQSKDCVLPRRLLVTAATSGISPPRGFDRHARLGGPLACAHRLDALGSLERASSAGMTGGCGSAWAPTDTSASGTTRAKFLNINLTAEPGQRVRSRHPGPAFWGRPAASPRPVRGSPHTLMTGPQCRSSYVVSPPTSRGENPASTFRSRGLGASWGRRCQVGPFGSRCHGVLSTSSQNDVTQRYEFG